MEKESKNQWRKEAVICGLFVFVLVAINFFIARSTFSQHCNHGIAFGIDLPQSVFICLWLATMIFVVCLLVESKKEWSSKKKVGRMTLGLYMILVGSIANMADRIIHGCVIDYIRIVPWNTFNLADTSIFCGAVLVLWSMHKKNKYEIAKKNSQ